MKDSLTKNKLKVLTITAILGVFFFSSRFSSFSYNKVDYYKKLFGEDFNFKIYEPKKIKSSKKPYLVDDKSGGFHLFVTSNINDDSVAEILEGKRLIFVCDNEFSFYYPMRFECDQDSVDVGDAYKVGDFAMRTFDWGEVYIVPENVLISPKSRRAFVNSIEAIRRSNNSIKNFYTEKEEDTVPEKISVSMESSVKNSIKNIKETAIFKFFNIALILLLIVSLTVRPLGKLCFIGKKFGVSGLKDVFKSFGKIPKYKKIILILFSFLLIGYTFLIIFISQKDGYPLNFGYILSYTISILKPVKLFESAVAGNYIELFTSLYVHLLAILIGVFLLSFVIDTVKISIDKVSKLIFKIGFIKYSLPIMIVLFVSSIMFFGLKDSYLLTLLILLIMVFVFLNNEKSKNFDYSYSKKDKIIFIPLFLLVIIGGCVIRYRGLKDDLEYIEKNLIGIQDEVVFLPYSKSIEDNTLINKYDFSGPLPIFVGHYLVYFPNKSFVRNEDIKEFKNDGSYYIQNAPIERVVKEIDSNDLIQKVLSSSEPTNFVKINYPNLVEQAGGVEIKINFTCVRPVFRNDTVEAKYYYVDRVGDVDITSSKIMYFPGCDEHSVPQSYISDLELPYTESKNLYIKIEGIEDEDIENIDVTVGDKVIDLEYLAYKEQPYSVLKSKIDGEESITNYIFDSEYSLHFDMSFDTDGNFDLSNPLNELLKNDVLKDKFLIWTTQKYYPIRVEN